MNPYKNLPPDAFWRSAMAETAALDISALWNPKFPINATDPICTFGSCFAQHIGKALKSRNFNWYIAEPAPFGLSDESLLEFNYDTFSCRTGNIYTTALLLQWTRWALGLADVPTEIWTDGQRYFDPFRPAIEPGGFISHEEMILSRMEAIRAFRKCIEIPRLFVFTLGLTESWFNGKSGDHYPLCPGTAAGVFDPDVHLFMNLDFDGVRDDLVETISLMRAHNSDLNFLLTVSPVPLAATNSGEHVLLANTYSKSVLRGVAGEIAHAFSYVDYFPSFELITNAVFRGAFYQPNQRTITKHGVNFVMGHFFSPLMPVHSQRHPGMAKANCEEEILSAFAGFPA